MGSQFLRHREKHKQSPPAPRSLNLYTSQDIPHQHLTYSPTMRFSISILPLLLTLAAALPTDLAPRQEDTSCTCQPQFEAGDYCGTCAGARGFVVFEIGDWNRQTTLFHCTGDGSGGCYGIGYHESCNVTYTPCGPNFP